MQHSVIGRPPEDGLIPDENDDRLWNLLSCAGGATGILYPRWRPLLDGPLFGAFGMDGSISPRAEMADEFARWANAHAYVWKSRPVQGEIGLVFVPESELFNYVQQRSTNFLPYPVMLNAGAADKRTPVIMGAPELSSPISASIEFSVQANTTSIPGAGHYLHFAGQQGFLRGASQIG